MLPVARGKHCRGQKLNEGQKVPVQTLQRSHAEGGQGRPLLQCPQEASLGNGSTALEFKTGRGKEQAPHGCPGGRGRTGKQGACDLVMQITSSYKPSSL